MAQLPLHGGSAPPWLFERMWKMAGAITMAVVDEYGPAEMLRRLAEPWWFQAFGCVLGFDWHSSGVTTVTCGAMKEAYKRFGDDLGIHVAGGKGGTSRKTPIEIDRIADRRGIGDGQKMIVASKMSAKVDSAAVQDGYELYHHSFFFDEAGEWCVVQQGMNDVSRYARRYHWLGERGVDFNFVCEPHNAIANLGDKQERPPYSRGGDKQECPPYPREDLSGQMLLNMVAREAEGNRKGSVELVRGNPDQLIKEMRKVAEGPTLFAPAEHRVLPSSVNLPRLEKIVRTVHERFPEDFRTLLGGEGVGAATIRSLSLLAELIYDAPASHRDPLSPPKLADKLPSLPKAERKWADYSYAHGGKDGYPFPVDQGTYDRSLAILSDAVRKARVGNTEKTAALKRLAQHEAGGVT
jgi:hypothetical protein